MAVSPVPAAFTTVGTDVVMVGNSYSYETAPLTPGKIIKVTKTQVTVEFKNGDRAWTLRFAAPHWRNDGGRMEVYGMRDSYRSRSTLILATDESITRRKEAEEARKAEATVKAAATQFAKINRPTADDVAALQAALAAYMPVTTNTASPGESAPVLTEGTNATE